MTRGSLRTLVAAALMAGMSAGVRAQDLPEAEKQRLLQLDALAAALQDVPIDRQRTAAPRDTPDQHYRKHSELHLRFLTCVATLANDNQDGLVVFPLQVSGLSYTIDSSQPGLGERESGADYQRVTIQLAGVRQPAPKATIDVPALRHGSAFDAVQIARDEIIERIRRFFPDALIDGRQKLYVKRLTVRNAADEPVRVWLRYRAMSWTAAGPTWSWRPAEPGAGQPLELTLAPGGAATVVDPTSGEPIEAGGVHLWAESESGERWLKHRETLLPLVDPHPELNGERAYYGTAPATFAHVIEPQPGPRTFAERVVELHNDSGESLDVRLRYRTKLDGRWTWRNARFTLAPGQRQQPLDGQGMRIRAARMNLRGETPNRRYQRHADEPLWLVDEAAGRRLYAADRIGKFIYIFTPRGEGAETSMARITAASATVMDGSRQVATVRRGDALEVVSTRPGWIGVRVNVGGTPQTGWIRDSDAEVTVTGPAADPGDPVRRTLVVTAAAAAVKVGPETIATLPRGAQSPVYEERDGWYRVEVQVEGSARHGWVQRGQVQVQ